MKKIVGYFSLMIVMSSSISYAEEGYEHKHHTDKKVGVLTGVESLSPELRGLLSTEMKALEKGMISVIPAYIAGDWKTIEDIGVKMKNSYILRQHITKKQIAELHSVLPPSFIKLDKEFHYFAGMLSHAAKKQKSELVGFYFSKLSESCVSCHSQYATHRFSGFNSKAAASKHAH